MEVKIEKAGQVNKFNLINSWDDVSLETYGKLIDFKEGNKTNRAYYLIKAMTDIPKEYVKQLALSDVAMILSKIAQVQSLQDGVLQSIIRIDGVNYGFHPDLDSITLGEYADIEHFLEDGYLKNFRNIMAVLYRPVTSRDGDKYSIEAYDGHIDERTKVMDKMSAKQVQGALVFFYRFATELLENIKWYLQEVMMQNQTEQLMEISKTAGDGSE